MANRHTYRPVRTPLMSMGPSLVEERRRHRSARTVAIASVVGVVALAALVWLALMLGREVVAGDATRAAAPRPVLPAGRPAPQLLAQALVDGTDQTIRLQVPINRSAVTGVGYDHRDDSAVVELDPDGERANLSWGRRVANRFLSTQQASDETWYQLGPGTPNTVVVGAARGTDVYAPLDGRVVAIADYVVSGEAHGVVVQIQPLGDGELVVAMRSLDPTPELAFGQTVSAGTTRIGTVRDLDGIVRQPLGAYTNDSGAGVEMYVKRLELGADT